MSWCSDWRRYVGTTLAVLALSAGAVITSLAAAPAGALAAGEGDMTARVARLLQPVRPLPATASAAICLASGLLVAATIALLIV